MLNATRPASLTASLLHREPGMPAARSGGLFTTKSAAPVEIAQVPLFCRKGEASAESFRSLRYPAKGPSAAVPAAAEPAPAVREAAVGVTPKCGEGSRLWLRVGPERRHRLKLAAAAEGQSCQAFLVSALDALLQEVAGPPGLGDTALLVVPIPTTTAASGVAGIPGARVKLACWVDAGRRARTLRAAQCLGQTLQAFLLAALDRHLDRVAEPRGAAAWTHRMADAAARLPTRRPAFADLPRLIAAGLGKGSVAVAGA